MSPVGIWLGGRFRIERTVSENEFQAHFHHLDSDCIFTSGRVGDLGHIAVPVDSAIEHGTDRSDDPAPGAIRAELPANVH